MHQSFAVAVYAGQSPAALREPERTRGQESVAPERKAVAGGGRSRSRRAVACPAVLTLPPRTACRIVRQIVLEFAGLAADRKLHRRDSRRQTCHIRQISMYVCHVVLQLSLSEIGGAFGRDRTTAGHACNVVEDRRDDAVFDDFVSAIERIVLVVFGPAGFGGHE